MSVYAGKIHKYAYKAPTGRKHGQGRCCTGLETIYLWTDIYMHARTLRNDRGWSPLQSLGVSVVQHKAGPVCARLWNGTWRMLAALWHAPSFAQLIILFCSVELLLKKRCSWIFPVLSIHICHRLGDFCFISIFFFKFVSPSGVFIVGSEQQSCSLSLS